MITSQLGNHFHKFRVENVLKWWKPPPSKCVKRKGINCNETLLNSKCAAFQIGKGLDLHSSRRFEGDSGDWGIFTLMMGGSRIPVATSAIGNLLLLPGS